MQTTDISNLQLNRTPPARLKKHKIAAAEWERVLQLRDHAITILDEDILVLYCLAFEEEQKWGVVADELHDRIQNLKAYADECKANGSVRKQQINQLQKSISATKANLRQVKIRRREKRELVLTMADALCIEPNLAKEG